MSFQPYPEHLPASMESIQTDLGLRSASAPAKMILKDLRVLYVVDERQSAQETNHAAPVSSSVSLTHPSDSACDGGIWETGEPSQTPTPYFGISTWSHDREKDYLPAIRDTEDGKASLGGIAFCIETTESLSLVTSFFLQYRVDFKEVHEVQR
ncbi:hypothetical protein F52700_255 [Fusarium sp. NRRL 52700]|nr:hypothetical protein F52700_255 [Fusarium sp. NRRL 52700]